MNDKRGHHRFKVNVSEVNGTVMFTWDVKVIDIGISGVSLEVDHKWSESIGYYKAFGITEYPGGERIKEAYHALAREFQPDQYPGVSGGVAVGTAAASSSAPVAVGHVISQSQVEDSGNVSGSSVDLMVSCGPAAKAGDASLTRLIIPRQVAATAGKAVTRYVYAVAASTAGELPVTVTLKVVPVAGVRVGINPASVRKELDGRTNFCFSPRIVCTESGTWQVKWAAKIGSSKDRNTANDVLTGTTRVSFAGVMPNGMTAGL